MNIVVLAGGLNLERDVSLASGSLVANALINNGHNVLLLDLYEGIKNKSNNYLDLFVSKESNSKYEYKIPTTEPNLQEIIDKNDNRDSLMGENVLDICRAADIVFIALHGSIGENGKLQAVFDTLGIKYTGCDYAGSMLAMDKELTKKLLVSDNISTAKYMTYNVFLDDINNIAMSFPLVIKPCCSGSSVGVSIVSNKEELIKAINLAKKYEDTLIIEEYIKGREVSIGVLGDTVLPPIEIIPKVGFYDYATKYQSNLADEICPADLTDKENLRIKELAMQVFNSLKLNKYARIDFILNEKDNEFYCLEANTLPGMTTTSLMPQEAKAMGISYEELCERIIKL